LGAARAHGAHASVLIPALSALESLARVRPRDSPLPVIFAALRTHAAHAGVAAAALSALSAHVQCGAARAQAITHARGASDAAAVALDGDALRAALDAAFAAMEAHLCAPDVQVPALRLLTLTVVTAAAAATPDGASALARRIVHAVAAATQAHPAHEQLQLSALLLLSSCVDNKLLMHGAPGLASVVPMAVAALARAVAAAQRDDARATAVKTAGVLHRSAAVLHFLLEGGEHRGGCALCVAAAEAGVHAALVGALRAFPDAETQERCCTLLYHACMPQRCHARAVDASVLAALVRSLRTHMASRTICFVAAVTMTALLSGSEREHMRADGASALAALVAVMRVWPADANMLVACCAGLGHAAVLGNDAADAAGGDTADETSAIAVVTRALLQCPSIVDVQRHGCSALAALASRAPNGRVPVARCKGAAAAAAAALTWACGEGADDANVAHARACACEALRCLAPLPGCRQEACAAGALEALVRLLRAPRLLDEEVLASANHALLALIADDAACQKRALAAGALQLPASAHPSRIALLTLLRGCVADGQSAAAADADAAAAALLAELDAESTAAAAAQHKRTAKQQKKKQAQRADAADDDDADTGASGSGAAGEPAQASHAADKPSGSGDAACEAASSASAKRRQKRTAAKAVRRAGAAAGGAAGSNAPEEADAADDAEDAAGSSAAAAAPDAPAAHAPDEQADAAAPAAVDAAPPDGAIAPAALFMQQMFPFLQLADADAAAALPPQAAPLVAPAPAPAPVLLAQAAAAAAAAAKEEEEDATLCVICLDARRCVALLPCKHLALCASPACAVMLGTPPLCPLCRVTVADTLQLFVPSLSRAHTARASLAAAEALDEQQAVARRVHGASGRQRRVAGGAPGRRKAARLEPVRCARGQQKQPLRARGARARLHVL
jgi:hypothetical protein